MIEKLKQIESKLLLDLLSKPNIWNTAMIDHSKPLVEKLWTQVGNYSITLQFIHHCGIKDAIYHLHASPSAIHMLEGDFDMGIGFGENIPDEVCSMFVKGGNMYYDMKNVNGWQYIRPAVAVCSMTMLSGKPWDRMLPESDQPNKEIDSNRKFIILEYFEKYYRRYFQGIRFHENISIKRGDWVQLDLQLMGAYDRRGLDKYFNINGFVVGHDKEDEIDARFGDDRIKVKSWFLKKAVFDGPKNEKEKLSTPVEKKLRKLEEDDDYDPDFD